MRKPVTLITGANGEIGQSLIEHLSDHGESDLLALDLQPLDDRLRRRCHMALVGDILDESLFDRVVSEYEIREIFHLAALLSTRAEYSPLIAHRVNVNGTLNLLHLAAEQAQWQGREVKFIFPSSIAIYGLPNLETKASAGAVSEDEFNQPTTMYGCNKLYCEQVGHYFSHHYRQLASDRSAFGVDFRSLRFPGLISAFTLPAGGTSDFASEMIHAAAQGKPYVCFVRAPARIPFMAMPDAVRALTSLAAAPRKPLERSVYNIGAFAPSADEIRDLTLAAIPGAEITFEVDPPRAAIIDSWPLDVDDSAARRDWDWRPEYDLERAFDEYLLPNIKAYYAKT